jgi:hypothetical protein
MKWPFTVPFFSEPPGSISDTSSDTLGRFSEESGPENTYSVSDDGEKVF